MKIEIWSDVMCPFCYIGKHKFETALKQLPFSDKVEVEWKSFQLAPDLNPVPGVDMYDMLAQMKGQTREWSVQMHDQVTRTGKEAGVEFHFEKGIPANTFDALRILQAAKSIGKGNEAEERMFRAFFSDGLNVADHDVLKTLALEIGLEEQEITNVLTTQKYADEVRKDIAEAQQLGVRGVPFFVFDRKYAVSGAQDVTVFTQTLEKSFQDWLEQHPSEEFKVIGGSVCRMDGTCD